MRTGCDPQGQVITLREWMQWWLRQWCWVHPYCFVLDEAGYEQRGPWWEEGAGSNGRATGSNGNSVEASQACGQHHVWIPARVSQLPQEQMWSEGGKSPVKKLQHRAESLSVSVLEEKSPENDSISGCKGPFPPLKRKCLLRLG
jgi:hypothetical protein